MKAEKTRELIKFRAEPEIRKALKLRAAHDDSNITTVIVDALRTYLAEQLREVRQRSGASLNSAESTKSSPRQKA